MRLTSQTIRQNIRKWWIKYRNGEVPQKVYRSQRNRCAGCLVLQKRGILSCCKPPLCADCHKVHNGVESALGFALAHGRLLATDAESATAQRVPCPVASGSATRRRRARAGPFGVQRARQLFVGIRVLLIADGSSFGVRHVSPDQFAQRSGPR